MLWGHSNSTLSSREANAICFSKNPSTRSSIVTAAGASWAQLMARFSLEGSRNIATMIATLIPDLINTILVGKYGNVSELAAVGMGNAIQNSLGLAIAYGLNTSMDSLASTAVHDATLGITYLNRANLATALLLLFVGPVFWYTTPIFLFLHQDPEVAAYAADYNRAALLGILFAFQANGLQRFLLNTGFSRAVTCVQVGTLPLHFAWCYLFVVQMGLANTGLGLANSLTWFTNWVCFFLIIARNHPVYFSLLKQFVLELPTRHNVQGMASFLAVAVPCSISLATDWVFYEVLALVVGLMGKTYLAAHVTVFNLAGVLFMVPYGLAVTASFFVGSAIGSGDARLAKRYLRITLGTTFTCLLVISVVIFIFASSMVPLYTRDSAVIACATPALRVFMIVLIPLGMQNVLASILRVVGKQRLTAYVYVVQNFGFSLPLSIFLGFYMNMHLLGVWKSLLCGNFCGATLVGFLVNRIDLAKEVQIARERMDRDRALIQSSDMTTPLL